MSNRPIIISVEGERPLLSELTPVGKDQPIRRNSFEMLLRECRESMPVDWLLERVKSRNRCLVGARPGLFLHSGRYYNERGYVEHATSECADPIAATNCVLAGERVLHDALSAREDAGGGIGADTEKPPVTAIFSINLDYGELHCNTSGCHENYSHIRPRSILRAALNPHLASRLIYTGPGGFHPHKPIAYILSPRAILMPGARERSENDGLFHPKTDNYASSDWQRLHIFCGEFNRSPLAWYAKLSTTALLVNLVDNGLDLDPGVCPLKPYSAFRTFATDITLSARVTCIDGVDRTALEMQWDLLKWAQDAVARGLGPAWAPQAIATWTNLLQRLDRHGRAGVDRSLDWAIKWSIYDAHCRVRGMLFDRLLAWNQPLEQLFKHSPEHKIALQYPTRSYPAVSARLRSQITPPIEFHGELPWDELPQVIALRRELRELEWRYAQLGDEAMFEKIRRAGVLDVEVSGINDESVRHAINHPPTDTRAWTRGLAIDRQSRRPESERAKADWNYIIDPHRQVIARMDSLHPCKLHFRPDRPIPSERAMQFDTAIDRYRTSRFIDSMQLLVRLRSQVRWGDVDSRREGTFPFRLLRYSAWVSARLGRGDAFEHLRRIHGTDVDASSILKVADFLYCSRFKGLAPSSIVGEWMAPALELMLARPPSVEPLQAAVREHVGAWHLYHGRLDAAEDAIGIAARETCIWRRARIHCLLADIERRRGRLVRAREFVKSAHPGEGLEQTVLVAEQITPMLAKLTMDAYDRRHMLDHAADILRQASNPMALARVLALRARGCRQREQTVQILCELQRLQRRSSALRECRLAVQIVHDWHAWCAGVESPETPDEFWGL